MPPVTLSAALRREYEQLFNTCNVRVECAKEMNTIVQKLLANRARYANVTQALGIPWNFVAVIHNMESSQNFAKHLHNGDPLTARTVQVPAGRPKTGNPPFSWEDSACDALTMKGLSGATDWSLAGMLFQLERYNGFGYRNKHPEVLTPYLWSYSNHYTRGKFVRDREWSDTAVSKQCGAAVLLRRMAELSEIEFPDQPAPQPGDAPAVANFSKKKSSDAAVVEQAKNLQRWLNTFPGIFVKEDGVPGERTSDAFKLVTGSYLPGDPRG